MGCGRFIGRVGALAVALGVGLAAPAVAAADPADDGPAGGATADTTATGTAGAAAADAGQVGESDDESADEPADEPPSADDSAADDDLAPEGDASAEDADSRAEADDEPGASRRSRPVHRVRPERASPAPHPRSAPAEPTEPAAAKRSEETGPDVRGRAAAPEITPAARVADSPRDVVVVSAPVRPTAAATTVTGVVARFLSVLGIGPSASGDGPAPLPSVEFVTAVLGTLRREIDRMFVDRRPTAAPSLSEPLEPGVVTGMVNAVDPDGDPLSYRVIRQPWRGSVSIDDAGHFSYTAGPHLAVGGRDSFVIGVRSAGGLFAGGTRVPVTVTPAGTDAAVGTLAAAATTTTTGAVFPVTTAGPDIVGFNPARDKLDLGDVSVHNFIVVDTAEGVGFRNPWSGETAVIQGVSLGQLTVDSFTPIINDHLRQDLSGALAWEHGVTVQPHTVYARSHEVGQIDRVAFDPATDVVDFRYYGTREQVYMRDTPEGVVISNAGTGQALILQGVTASQLTARNFVFHSAQVREDRVHLQLGIGTVPDAQIRPQGVPVAGTTVWPTAAGNGAPPVGQTGTTTKIAWNYGAHTVLDFDPAIDRLDFGWFKAPEFDVSESNGSTRIAIADNNQSYTLAGVALGDLTLGNIIALDSGALAKWQNMIYQAAPAVPRPALSVGDAGVAEGQAGTSTLAFAVSLSKASTETVSVGYTTSNSTATAAGADYVPTVGTLVFAPGETSKTVLVGVNGDTLVELDEQLTLTLSSPVNATIADGTGIGTIRNDDVDQAPATPPAISIGDLSVVEGNGEHSHFMFVVTLDKASTDAVTVRYTTANGTATAGNDFTATSGTVTFAPGVTTQLVHVDVLGDTAREPNETFTVALSNPTGATIGDGTAVGTITDDDAPAPPAGTSSVSYVVKDNWGSGFVAAVTVAAGSTALSGWRVEFDSPAQIGNIWNAEIVNHTGTHYVVRNAAWNADVAAGQTVEFGFQASPGGASAAAGNFVVNGVPAGQPTPVVPPKVSVADAAVVESNSGTKNLVFSVTLDKASTTPVTVSYATGNGTAAAGTDFTATSGVLTFAAGVTSRQISVPILGDTTVEPNETLTLTLSNPAGATIADGSAVGTITNDDVAAPTPGNASASFVVTDNWGSGFTGAVTVTAGSSGLVGWTVEFDTPAQISNIWNAEIVSHTGNHYVVRNAAWNPTVAAGKTVSFGFQASPGGASATVTDVVVNGKATAQPPTITVADAAVTESQSGSTSMTFIVALSKASSDPVTVSYATANGTATAGADYTATSGTVTFAPGVLSQQIRVSVAGDTVVEPNETFTLSLSNPSGATLADGIAVGTITNDDVAVPGPVSLSISDASVTEGAPGNGAGAGYLSTSGNQIVDAAGKPVQIAGVNWFGFESDIRAPHGLWTRNYKDMLNQMADLGFNTIRVPYSSEMLHSTAAPTGIDLTKNPDLAGLTSLQIMDKIVAYAGDIGMRVILDHHRSTAGAGTSENGLWYNSQYSEASWIADWQMLAQRYAGNPTVIGADLHNEPYNGTWGGGGATDWAAAAERAGNAVLAVNPKWLIFVEGVATYQGQSYWWGGNLMGVKDRPIALNVPNRVVYSPHDYPNSVYNQPWFAAPNFGAALPDKFEQMWGYLYEQNIAPVYLGEFGTRLTDPKDVIWYEAITSYLSGDFDNNGTIDIPAGTQDMSWTFWSWNPNSTDTGGILSDDWNTVNTTKMAYLSGIQFDFDEGSPGVLARFVVSLTAPSTQPVTVRYATSDGTARAGDDYAATTGTVTFQPGETSKTVTVVVFGDTRFEDTESFVVTLSSPTGATIADGVGAGAIYDRAVL